ncbi:hypothetical protein SAY87_022226 [Trapa incisa]|uniref:Topoisomerase 6 subunit A/Spo11 TOPRIM domain-containing protein n=1 Tax=Trapa incisa TaxID=236973 RepID=A0AAN7JY92_9MYRT|nr:hypothetical protein SAY87_022226 [Trapa incisa]
MTYKKIFLSLFFFSTEILISTGKRLPRCSHKKVPKSFISIVKIAYQNLLIYYVNYPFIRFLKLLIEKLHLPVYCLVDCDPYGFDILCTYRFGSMQLAYDARHLRVQSMRWLGAFPSDSEKYSVPEQCLIPLTGEDKKRTEAMLERCYLQREAPQWRPWKNRCFFLLECLPEFFEMRWGIKWTWKNQVMFPCKQRLLVEKLFSKLSYTKGQLCKRRGIESSEPLTWELLRMPKFEMLRAVVQQLLVLV